jgi:hypothetical protein
MQNPLHHTPDTTVSPLLPELCAHLAYTLAGHDDNLARDLLRHATQGELTQIVREVNDFVRMDADEANTRAQHEEYKFHVKAAFTALRDAMRGSSS